MEYQEIDSDWRLNALVFLEPNILYYARKYKNSEMTIDDYKQDLTIQLWNKLDKFDPSKSSLKTWASRVMWHKCIDISRIRNAKKRQKDFFRIY